MIQLQTGNFAFLELLNFCLYYSIIDNKTHDPFLLAYLGMNADYKLIILINLINLININY